MLGTEEKSAPAETTQSPRLLGMTTKKNWKKFQIENLKIFYPMSYRIDQVFDLNANKLITNFIFRHFIPLVIKKNTF